MKISRYILSAAFLFVNHISVAQNKGPKIDSLQEILALEFYEMKWSSSVRTASKILSLDSSAVEAYVARAMSYLHLKDRIKPDFDNKNSKSTKQYLTLIKLAKADLEKVGSGNSPGLTGDAAFQEKVKNNIDSCNLILQKYQR